MRASCRKHRTHSALGTRKVTFAIWEAPGLFKEHNEVEGAVSHRPMGPSKGNNYQPPAEKTRPSPPITNFTLATNTEIDLEKPPSKVVHLIRP